MDKIQDETIIFQHARHFPYQHKNKKLSIKVLELISFNLDKKKRLKNIFETYNSNDFIVELLSKLYKKKIKLINMDYRHQ